MMDFELKLTRTTYREAMVEGVVMAASYSLGKPCVVHLAWFGWLTFTRRPDPNDSLPGHQG
jgi:hypothetical protein